MLHTNANVARQMEVSVDNTEYASPQNQTYIEGKTTADANHITIKWKPVYAGKPGNVHIINELIAIKILTTGIIPNLDSRE